jgi:hypothetical protein
MSRLPLWSAELLTGAKSFEHNGIIGNAWLNRHGLHTGRVSLAHRLAASRRARLAAHIPAQDRAAFDRDGFVVRPGFLPDTAFQALRDTLRNLRLTLRERCEGDTILRKIAVTPALLRELPALRHLLDHQDWRALIAYAGARDSAPGVHLQSVQQQAASGAQDPQTFLHADTFHPTVKAWLYLTDVPAQDGPLSYVPGSHRLTPERLAWEQRMSLQAHLAEDEDTRDGSFRIGETDLAALGLPPPRPLPVAANTLIVADTFGFHARARSTRRSLRVEVWGVGPRNPFLPWTGLDPLIAKAGRRKLKWNCYTGSLFDAA